MEGPKREKDIQFAASGNHSICELCLSLVFVYFPPTRSTFNHLLISISKVDKGKNSLKCLLS